MLLLLPEAEGEEVDVVMTAALGSMASRYQGSQSVHGRGNGCGSGRLQDLER